MPWGLTEGVLGAVCSGGSGGVGVRVSCNVMAGQCDGKEGTEKESEALL